MKPKKKIESYEVLSVPFLGLDEVGEGDNLSDLGELQEGEIRGVASVFGEIVDAHVPTIMRRGAFTKTLQERARALPILWQHDMDEPIGKPTRIFETEQGLVLQAQIMRTTRGRDALTLIRGGVVGALSIGFDPVQFDFEQQADGSMIRFIREARLVEISVVTLGADPNALITEVRSGCVAGSLDRYVIGKGVETRTYGEEVTEPTVEQEVKGTDSLASKLEVFSAEYLASNQDASDYDVAEAFAATLHKAEPSNETLTLAVDVDHQLQMAELLAAQMLID